VSGVVEADPEEGEAALRADHACLEREGSVIGFGAVAVHAEVGHGRRVGGIQGDLDGVAQPRRGCGQGCTRDIEPVICMGLYVCKYMMSLITPPVL